MLKTKPLQGVAMELGRFLARLLASACLGILFCVVVVPLGLAMRFLGKDPLKLNWDPRAGSYWIQRNPPGPSQESLKDPF